jgi:hypothetical protein
MKSETVILIVVAAAAALYLVTKKSTPTVYYPPGSIGGYGVQTHVPVATAGVALAGLLGSGLSSWFGGGASSPAGIAPDANTPIIGRGTITNPIYPIPSVLPYSYKQQVIDTPAILGTDSIFTPPSNLNSNFGSGYADQGSNASDNIGSGTSTYFGDSSSGDGTTSYYG